MGEARSGVGEAGAWDMLTGQPAPHLRQYVAIDLGYYDQAHLIRDFNEFTGATPGVSLAGR